MQDEKQHRKRLLLSLKKLYDKNPSPIKPHNMKAPLNIRASEPQKNSAAPSRKTKTVHATMLVQGLTESRGEKDFIALVQARRISALEGNSIEVGADDL